MSALDEYLARHGGSVTRPSAAAGPRGMQPAADAHQGAMEQYLASHGGSFTEQAGRPLTGAPTMDFRKWYSGQNLEGPGNGWDTDFQRVFQTQLKESYERGDMPDFFTRDQATGVVTWDNAKGRNDQRLTFGDVVVRGEKVGNVYEDFDRHTANVMMGDYLVQTGDRKRQLNEERDFQKAWEEEIAQLRAMNTQKVEVAPRAEKFEAAVREELETDPDRGGIVAGGIAGGVVLGAGIGSFFPGAGTLIGGAIGGVISGIGAWLNSDSLTYQLARSQEQLKLAKQEGAGIQATLSMVAQNTMSIGFSPLQNILQGTYDAMGPGGVGGGTLGGEFQKVNDEGERVASGVWQAANLVALIGDSALQFASPAGRIAYQAQMTAQIGSGVIGLLPGQGMWDERLLRQNSVWTRDEYNAETGEWEQKFDLGNSLAGVGYVAIDAVQLGAWSSLSRANDALGAQIAKRTGQPANRFLKPMGWSPFEKVNLSPAQRKALKAGGSLETHSGYKFVINEAGEIVGKQRMTLAMLAPSEGLQALTAKAIARRDAARRAGAVSAEDLYQAASDLALGQRGLQAMLVNAVGEGQEEALQAILEPWSQDHAVDGRQVIEAGLMGAAAGFGMTGGTRLGRPSQDLQMYAAARLAHALQTNGEQLSFDEWNQMSHLQKRAMVKSAGLAKSLTDGAFQKIEKDRIDRVVGGVVEAAALEDYYRAEEEVSLKRGVTATDQAAPIVMHESYTFRPDALATSHTQLQMNQADATRGARLQLEELDKRIANASAAAKKDPSNTKLAEREAQLRATRQSLQGIAEQSARLEQTIDMYVEAIDAAFERENNATAESIIDDAFERWDNATAESLIDGLNASLEAMYDMTESSAELAVDGRIQVVPLTDEERFSLSRAVGRIVTRDPADSSGSWQSMLPQVHKVFASRKADGIYGVSQIILKPIRGDYDGDKIRILNQLVVDDADYVALRAGENVLGAAVMPEIASTKFEQAIATRAMQVWHLDDQPLGQAARKIALDIEASLKERYHNETTGRKPIGLDVISDVTKAVQEALATGGDIRETVLSIMSARAGGVLQQIGRGLYAGPGQPKLSNEMYWIANMVTRHIQTFQSYYAEHTPKRGVPDPGFKVVDPSETTTDIRRRSPLRGPTPGQTADAAMPGSHKFRIFQKLHYTLWETTDKYAGWAADLADRQYQELVEHYESLSQGVVSQRLERMSPSDKIIGQVWDWLEQGSLDAIEMQRLGLHELSDMALMANVGVGQMIYKTDKDGSRKLWFTGHQVTYAQHLLYLSLEKFRRQNAQVWDKDPDLRAAYNNLMELTKPNVNGDHPGNSEMAFVRIFENARLYDLVGVDAVSLGVNLTVGQFYRQLINLSVPERTQAKYRARSGAYQDSESGLTIPFTSAQLDTRAVTGYKSLVDSLFSAADSSISQRREGKNAGEVIGRFADQSNERGELIQDTWREVTQLLRELLPKKGRHTAAEVSRLANENPEFGRVLMDAIPPSARPWVMQRQEPGKPPEFSRWFYDVWTQPTAEEAEMSYFRNLVLNSWYAKVRQLDIDFANGHDTEHKKIAFDSLDSRMHQLIFRLSSRSVVGAESYDPFSLREFLTKFDEAKSVKKFMKWVNSADGLVVEGAPLLAWKDEVSEFDPSRAGGGWSNQLTTPALMESLRSLKATAHRLIKETKKSAEISRLDVQTGRAIERWHRHLKDPTNQDLLRLTRNGDEEIYGRFVRLLEKAAKRRMSNGPRAMIQHTAHLVYGIYGPAHAKGEISPQMAANAALEALDNAIGYLTPAERVLGDLTAHNEDAVAQAPHMLLRGGGRMMTRHGAQSEWELNSVEAMLPLITKPENHKVMRAVLFDTVMELDADDVPRRKFLMGSTLDEVMSKNTVKDLFDDEGGSPELKKAMIYLSKLEGELRDSEKHYIQQKVTELVLARTTALDRGEVSFEEIQGMTVQAYLDLATVLQTIGRTRKRPGEEDPAIKAHTALAKAAKIVSISKTYGISPEVVGGSLTELQVIVRKQLTEKIVERINRAREMAEDTSRSASERAAFREALKREENALAAEDRRIDQLFDLNVTQTVVDNYAYNSEADEAQKHARQTTLMEYVHEHGELMQAAGPALTIVNSIKNHFEETARGRKLNPFKLPEKDWETLSSVIISVEIQRILTVGPASNPPPPYPAPLKPGEKGLDKSKYWDHSFSYLFDFLSPTDNSGIVEAARRLAVDGGMLQASFDEHDIIDKVSNRIMRADSIGQWGPEIPIESIESYELLTGASSKPSISMHGLISQRWGAAMIATERTAEKAVADTTAVLTWDDLNWEDGGLFKDITVTRDDGRTFERQLLQLNNRFVSELSFTYGSATQPVDLMQRRNLARLFLPALDEPGGTDFREVNLLRLREEIDRTLREMYPGTAEPEMQKMLRDVEITMKYVNPDSQPDDEGYANNVWYEGTVYDSAGDTHRSLLEAFFYGIGALNARGQQAALDTRKLGLMGIEDYKRPEYARVLEIEEQYKGTDFSRMLALKTEILMDTAIGNGKPIDPAFYNAAYKLMKLKHWVDGVDRATNEKQRWSAEQVIAWQMKNEGKDFFTDPDSPLREVKLWIPSDQVLADMMGDIGYGGVRGRALKRELTDDLTTIDPYTGRWTEAMEEKFPLATSGKPVTLMDTDVALQAYVQDLRVSTNVTPQERVRFQRKVEAMQHKRSAALVDRLKQVQRPTFNPVENRERNMGLAIGWVSAEDVSLPGLPDEMRYLEREHGDILTNTLMALDSYMAEQHQHGGDVGSSFWIFQETGTSSIDEGRLMKSDLSGGLSIVPGEVVFFDVAGYATMDPKVAREKALERVDYFVNRGATLMFGTSGGNGHLASDLQQLTQSRYGYQRYLNNNRILVPEALDESTFQSVAAARSRLVATDGVPISRQRVSMLLSDMPVEESTMWVRKGRGTKFDAIQAVFDLLPIDVHAQFNTPVTRDDAAVVQNYLTALDTEGLDLLREEALRDYKPGPERDQAEIDFDKAWDRLLAAMPARVQAATTQPLIGEEFGTGDFIPLLNSQTGELLLYRHGYSHPKPADYLRQLRQQVPGTLDSRGVVMYSGKMAPTATTHRGTVIAIRSSPGRGFRMELEIPVQTLGEKITFEHNGMKYLLTEPEDLDVPSIPLFGNIDIDGFASVHDTVSKEASYGLVTSFRNAFAFFGIDFREDLKEFFGTETVDEAIRVAKTIARTGEKMSVEEVYRLQSLMAGQDAYFSAISGMVPQLTAAGIDVSAWSQKLLDSSANAAIGRAFLVYLLSPNADVDAILGSSGFFVDNPSLAGAQSQLMPELFTRAFDLAAPDSAIKAELEDRINAKLNKDAGTGEYWHFSVNSWTLEGVSSSGKAIRGLLQFGEAYATEDNPLLNLMAQERKDKQSATRHQGLMNRIGVGGITFTKSKKRDRLASTRAQDLAAPDQIGSLWHDLTFVDPSTNSPGSRWQNRTPAEVSFYGMSIQRFTQYRHAIDFSDESFKNDIKEIESGIDTIVNRLGLRPSQTELVHYWIRQMLYFPAESQTQEDFDGGRSPSDVLGAIRAIMKNLNDGYFPTYNAAGPSFFAYDDLSTLFLQYQRDESTWAPYRKERDPSTKLGPDNIGDWIGVAFGQAINSQVDFDPIYRLDMAGFMNTYQTVLRNSGYMMDITFDKDYQRKLLDPKTNELLSVTLDPTENTRLTEQVLMTTEGLEYEDLVRGSFSGTDKVSRGVAANWRQRRLTALARWRARNKVHPVKAQSTRDFLRAGTEHINKDADMHSLQRMVIALRHGMAMLNPGLYLSMIPEQGFRMYLSEMTNMLTGESTLRSVSGVQRGISKLTGNRLELNLYSAEQIDQLNKLFTNMGNDGAFTSLIIQDMMWERPGASPGKWVSAAERFAAFGNKWQDATWGTTQKSLARHYFEGIMRSIESMPTKYVMTPDSVIAHLRTDPTYFAREHKDLHKMASNYVIDFRSLKQTPASIMMRAMYEPWATSGNGAKRFAGTLLKLQAMYATYNMNVLTTLTGMQGYSDMLAVFLDGKRTPGSWLQMFWKARNGEQILDEDRRLIDMSSAIDGVTIANSFIRGGVTQTGLFMLGMAFGGILSGEDEEAKRRRRLAEAQNAPLIMDPRRLELDFRNKDVIFLDWLPPAFSAFFRVQGDDGVQGARSAAQISWILKPFISPILGMERFFMTGDFSYVTHGFMDAVGSLPLFFKGKWDDAVRTAAELEALAAEEQEAGTPTSLKNTMYLLSSAVATYESMLLENMFLNSLYTGFDMYDRDPTKLVLRDSDGDIQRTIENNARPNDVALTEFPSEDGIGTGYMKRDPLSAGLAAYTENNFTAAAMLSLFRPFHNQDFLRGDMPVRERKIEMPKLTNDEAKVAVILATLNQQKAQGQLERRLSLDEVTKLLKDKILRAEDWEAFHNLDALALKFYESPNNPQVDPLTALGPQGQEVLTKSGHAALFKGLMNGTIALGDPEMRGIAITPDQRKELERDFFEDYTREGRDLGLTQEQAEKRALRLMLGPLDDPTVIGFREVLWDKRIPWSPDLRYKQLNTTFVQGPDGFPWATGYKRGGAPGMGGFWNLLGGLKRPTSGSTFTDAIAEDSRMNSADMVSGINTGLRGLVPMNESELIPTDWEQTQAIIDALKGMGSDSGSSSYVPNSNGGGRGTFYRGGYRSGYGGGRSGYSPTIYWSRQPTLPRGANIYGNTARNLFWNNANIRRTTIRRERYQSTRGRLNQWQ